jgi:hypothetical protein
VNSTTAVENDYNYEPSNKSLKVTKKIKREKHSYLSLRKCYVCFATTTPMWRHGNYKLM